MFVLLKATSETMATLRDYDDLSTLLAGSSNEADFTNYLRKEVATATITVDDTNDRVDIDIADQTWTAAGGGTNNSLDRLLICYDPDNTAGTDTTIVPITAHDFIVTTDGSDLTAQIAASGFYRAS